MECHKHNAHEIIPFKCNMYLRQIGYNWWMCDFNLIKKLNNQEEQVS
jgi:hypothetical protein